MTLTDPVTPAPADVVTRPSQGRRSLMLAAIAASFGFSQAACSTSPPAVPRRLHIVLDPGHTPAQGGATGVRGIREVQYNDHFTHMLAKALQAEGHRITVTRTPAQEITLDQRAELANASEADLFLAIHHDSAQVHYLDKIEVDGLTAWRTKTPIRGYSLFVSQINPRYESSLSHARAIAARLLALGRKPTLHHAEKIPGENRELLDSRLGIYRFDELLVLRKTRIPALLLEIGVIVDAEDEAYVRDSGNQTAMIAAIVKGLSEASLR